MDNREEVERLLEEERAQEGDSRDEKLKYVCCIVISVILSCCTYHLYSQNSNQADKISDLQKNLVDLMVRT